jgi:hypothetical protein
MQCCLIIKYFATTKMSVEKLQFRHVSIIALHAFMRHALNLPSKNGVSNGKYLCEERLKCSLSLIKQTKLILLFLSE